MDRDADISRQRIEDRRLGVARLLAGVKGIHAHDQLQRGAARGELEQNGDVREGGDDTGEGGVVEDVLRGVGTQGVVDGDGEEGLGHAAQICIFPVSHTALLHHPAHQHSTHLRSATPGGSGTTGPRHTASSP